MEELFVSDVITICYDQQLNTLLSKWHGPDSAEHYVDGIKAVKQEFDKIITVNTLWDNREFNFEVPKELQMWTDRFLNVSAVKAGFNKKMALIVGKDLIPAMSVINLVQNSDVAFQSGFFSNEKQAIDWITSKETTKKVIETQPAWQVSILNDTKALISLEVDLEDLAEYLKDINRLLRNRQFIVSQQRKFDLLTKQEKNILLLILKGYSNEGIANQLFISISTIKTHRNHINKKLGCNTMIELLLYNAFF